MKKPFIFLILSFFLFNRAAIADYWDTGWMEFKQPNGTKFIGRILGDEYEFQNITKDGYPFDKSPQNNYYYYAERAVSYKYILSDKKVGIDIPSGIEKNLKVFMDSRPGPSSLSGTGLKKNNFGCYNLHNKSCFSKIYRYRGISRPSNSRKIYKN